MKDQKFEVKGNWHYTRVDNAIMEDERVTTTDQSVYVALCSFANVQTKDCFPSYPTLMKRAHIKSRVTLRKSLKNLEESGCINVLRKPGGNNIYTVWVKYTSTENVLPSTEYVLPQYNKCTLTRANKLESINESQKPSFLSEVECLQEKQRQLTAFREKYGETWTRPVI